LRGPGFEKPQVRMVRFPAGVHQGQAKDGRDFNESSLMLNEVMQASVQNALAFLYFRLTLQLDFH
jgi:hypothetical protein